MAISVGQYLINHHIPDKYKIGNNVSSKDINSALSTWAKDDPQSYAENVTKIKRVGDQISMYEGLSIGLDDLDPLKKERDKFLKKYQPKLDAASSIAAKKKIVSDAVKEGAGISMKAKSSLVDMVTTGAKGNPAQLMKNNFSPVSARQMDGTSYPYLIDKSYSEGLSPGGYWVSAIEARNAAVEGKTKTAEPGDFGKQLFNALNNMVVSNKDCGTDNGIYLGVDDPNVLDRYLAKNFPGVGSRNTLVTDKVVQAAKKKRVRELMVRSPMTCESRNGVCQNCYGLNPSGKLHSIGSNVGTLAAQSLSEPLTQMTLSAKHGVSLSGPAMEEVGMTGVRKLLTKPSIFPSKAALAQTDGTVTDIRKAPQGGTYVYVNGLEHYVPTTNEVIVKKNQKVTKGDSLSNGLKDPREFTNLRGIGSGRSYLINAMYNAYNPLDPSSGKRTGISVDKRHLEVLAKKDLNHVVIDGHNDTFSKGDVVEYNKLKDYMVKGRKEVPLSEAIGEYLGKEYLHYTVGTQVTASIAQDLRNRGISKIMITQRNIPYSPHVVNIRRIPLLKDNFLARLTHSEIKNSLINAATKGETSEISGYDPIPSFIKGVNFGEGIDGRY